MLIATALRISMSPATAPRAVGHAGCKSRPAPSITMKEKNHMTSVEYRNLGKAPKKKRHVPGQMNLTEKAFEGWLRGRKEENYWCDWKWDFEVRSFKVATKCWYHPDFYVIRTVEVETDSILYTTVSTTLYAYDVKARYGDKPGVTDDALVKIKVAAEKFPDINWAIAWPGKGSGLKSTDWQFRWFGGGEE